MILAAIIIWTVVGMILYPMLSLRTYIAVMMLPVDISIAALITMVILEQFIL